MPMVKFESTGLYEWRQPQGTRALRRFTLSYKGLPYDEWQVIDTFMRLSLNYGTLKFDWQMPPDHGMDITSISTANPRVVFTTRLHGFVTGDYVIIRNAASAVNGVRRVTLVDQQHFSLDGLSGGTSIGVVKNCVNLAFPYALIDSDTIPAPEKVFGPMADNHGFYNLDVPIIEARA